MCVLCDLWCVVCDCARTYVCLFLLVFVVSFAKKIEQTQPQLETLSIYMCVSMSVRLCCCAFCVIVCAYEKMFLFFFSYFHFQTNACV